MKKIQFILYLLFSGLWLSAQDNLSGYEYWFNNDYGTRQTVPVALSEEYMLNTSIDASLLPEGVNVFNIRYKSNDGIFSSTLSEIFYKNTLEFSRNNQLTGYEYWFNNDYSTRQVIAFGNASEHLLNAGIDASSLPDGVNLFNIRFKNEDGICSSTLSEIFYKSSEIFSSENLLTAYEFWFNNDYDTRQIGSIENSGEFFINTGVDALLLPEGVNIFNVKVKDDQGIYSSTMSEIFYKYAGDLKSKSKIVAYEYWLNNNFADRQTISFGPTDEQLINTGIETSALPEGVNIFNIRFIEENGLYSGTLSQVFVKTPKNQIEPNLITAFRYWFDDDFEGVKDSFLTTGITQLNLIDNLDLTSLPKGKHSVNFQIHDIQGKWSVVSTDSITKTAIPTAVFSVNALQCSNSPVVFTNESIDTDTWLWDFGDGETSTIFEPVHYYNDSGDFEVTLTSIDSETGKEDSQSQIITVQQSYGVSMVATDNLIAYYPFDGDAKDASGNGHDGTVNGATLIEDRNGIANSAYLFDGNDGILIPHSDELNMSGALSFTCWIKPAVLQNAMIFGKSNYTTATNYLLRIQSDGNLQWEYKGYLNTTTQSIEADKWYHIAVTANNPGEYRQVYLNGQLIAETNSSSGPFGSITNPLTIGYASRGAEYFKGVIDELKMYNRALSAEEIQLDYEGMETTIPLVAAEICASEIPFAFGTQQLYESGTYSETFQTIFGCDSVVQLNLTVHPEYDVEYAGSDITLNYLVNDDFESDTPGTLPDGWIIRYEGTGVADQKVVESPVKNGVHSFQVSGSSWAANLSKSVANIPDRVTLEGWMRAENVASGGRCGLGIGNPSIGSWGAFPARVEFYNGNLITFYYTGNTGGYGTQYVLQAASANTWYHIKIETDKGAGTYKVYINGEQASSNTGGPTIAEFPFLTTASPTSVELYGNSMIYFDDIKLYETEQSQVKICANDMPYKFGTLDIYDSGIYTETFKSVYGCDSIVTLKLEVIPNIIVNDEITVCISDLPYQFGSQNLTESGEYTEAFPVSGSCDSLVILNFKVRDCSMVCEKMVFSPGWNIFSVNSLPDSLDIEYLFNPFIDNSTLVKIQDEQGNSFEDWGFFGGWTNNIGDISPQEGYKIKLNSDDSIQICGLPVEFPFGIPLETGWNIVGYPQTVASDGMDNIVKELIDRGTLIKVQDETGSSIEDWGFFGGWTNNIGDFIPGEGYKVKVNAPDTLWIYSSYPKSTVGRPEIVATKHFKTEFEGNGVDHMDINLVGLPVNLFKASDEIAVFDGTTCVGSVTLLPYHLSNQTVSIATSATDNFGMKGFKEGNPVIVKFWSSMKKQEYILEPEIIEGTGNFIKHETLLASLEKYAISGLDEISGMKVPEINCYPNPFSEKLNIEINLPENSRVNMLVLNHVGQKIKTIFTDNYQNRGKSLFVWDGCNENNQTVSVGMYYLQVKINEVYYYHKIILTK